MIDDAIADGLFQAVCHVTKKPYSAAAEMAWRTKLFDDYGDHAEEELLCVPSSSSGVFLPSVLIESRMDPEVPVIRWECPYSFLERGNAALFKDAEDFCLAKIKPLLSRISPDLMSCFGEDFGRSGDLTVIWPLQLGKSLMRRTPFVLELRNVPFKQQEQILFYIVDHLPRFIGGAMDARGNGQYLAETAQLRYGSRVEAVMLSQEWYRDNMPRYKAAFEDANIELPKDADILADHRMLRMEKGVAKSPSAGCAVTAAASVTATPPSPAHSPGSRAIPITRNMRTLRRPRSCAAASTVRPTTMMMINLAAATASSADASASAAARINFLMDFPPFQPLAEKAKIVEADCATCVRPESTSGPCPVATNYLISLNYLRKTFAGNHVQMV
jgi:hypothetical protein